ncbi:hypothetical protein CYMTET_10382 [Cymbomonas tetramitiformis]|uniref:Histone deacetylase complex subunit SAP30 Sin3 binding domain-containing protein n=1 Tax=Cymbomonas tetramitiformis TaxID=36881 RepID=A0AAE0LDW7_9CHLO|nr:hypothetical protein CYMTET_10382 [Cymbomonas tetramitiformis]
MRYCTCSAVVCPHDSDSDSRNRSCELTSGGKKFRRINSLAAASQERLTIALEEAETQFVCRRHLNKHTRLHSRIPESGVPGTPLTSPQKPSETAIWKFHTKVHEQRTSADMTNGAPKRSNRGGAATNGASNHNGSGGSSDEEERNVAATPPTHPTQRTSARRKPNIDLLKLEASSLRKYRRVYKLPELGAGVGKEDLAPAIIKHWQNHLVVEDEYETLLSFAMTLRKQSIASGGASGMHGKMKQKGPKRK